MIHRAVNPGNILLAGAGPEELLAEPTRDPGVKLVDFGIVGLVEHAELSEKSRSLGTAAYVAPEALEPGGEFTPAADVYGAGVVAYASALARIEPLVPAKAEPLTFSVSQPLGPRSAGGAGAVKAAE
ncbi:MAG: protein kinase, partial [bacterium]|nr:protein kinase [bacterium]